MVYLLGEKLSKNIIYFSQTPFLGYGYGAIKYPEG